MPAMVDRATIIPQNAAVFFKPITLLTTSIFGSDSAGYSFSIGKVIVAPYQPMIETRGMKEITNTK